MSAVTPVPASVVTVKVRSSPGSVGGAARSGLPSSTCTPSSASWRRSSALRSGAERAAEHVVGHVDERHLLGRPDRLDLPGQLDADRPGPHQQYPGGGGERRVGAERLLVGVHGTVHVALGREGIAGPGGQHDVVRREFLAGGQHHPPGVHLHGPVLHHPAVAEQPAVGQVDPRQPGRVDQGAQRGDVVHERVFRLDQHDRGHVVQRLGHADPGVAAADDHHGRPGRGRLAHLNSLSVMPGCLYVTELSCAGRRPWR